MSRVRPCDRKLFFMVFLSRIVIHITYSISLVLSVLLSSGFTPTMTPRTCRSRYRAGSLYEVRTAHSLTVSVELMLLGSAKKLAPSAQVSLSGASAKFAATRLMTSAYRG